MTSRRRVSKQKELSVLELARELGLTEGIVIIYGASGVGKTTFTLATMREYQGPKLYIASEPNVFYDGRISIAKKIAEADYVKELPEAFRRALMFLQKHKEALVAIDSVSAFAQHEAAKRLMLEGEVPQPLSIVGPLSFAANAMSQALAEHAIEGKSIVWLIAQERPAIGRPWRGEDAAPSFAMRAIHSVYAVARLIYTGNKRILKVVMHRDPSKEGLVREVPHITL